MAWRWEWRVVKVKKIDPRAIGVEVAGCQGGGGEGVKVNKIDPFAIKTTLTQKTGDQTFE